MKLFVKIASIGRTIPIELPEHATIAQLRGRILERAQITESSSAQLIHKGRLVSGNCESSLRACELADHTTLTLTCQSLLGGSEDDDFQRADLIEKTTSEMLQGKIEPENDCIDTKMGDSEAV